MSLLPSESAFRYQLPTRRVCKGCYFHNRGHRNVADHREQGSAGSAPGALAKAVISTIEAVGSACMRFAADHREQARGGSPPRTGEHRYCAALHAGQTAGQRLRTISIAPSGKKCALAGHVERGTTLANSAGTKMGNFVQLAEFCVL